MRRVPGARWGEDHQGAVHAGLRFRPGHGAVGRAQLNEGGISGKIIMRIRIAAAAAAIAALAGCGSSGSHVASPPASPSSTAAPASTAPPPLTCSTGTNDNGMTTTSQVIRMLVSDQKSQDKALEENWVTVTDGS